jgi:hypothetical protein
VVVVVVVVVVVLLLVVIVVVMVVVCPCLLAFSCRSVHCLSALMSAKPSQMFL